MGGCREKGGKSDVGEKRHCVDLVATLADLPPLPPSSPPSSMFPVLSFFPPVLPGIKTSIHAPEETHSRGEKRGEEKGAKDEGVSRWDSFVDHWDQAHCLKSCDCLCLCLHIIQAADQTSSCSAFFFSCSVESAAHLSFNQLRQKTDLMHSSGSRAECFLLRPRR